MKVHHLNCGSMCFPGTCLVCHVLLIESDNGLVLVDSGFGNEDIDNPRRRIGPYRMISRPALDRDETALAQIEQLGFHRHDVRHIVLTHFDIDHIGGISDFPEAQVHVSKAEVQAVREPLKRFEKARYRHVRWALQSKLVEHEPTGEAWQGFPVAQELTDIAPGIVMIPLPGHSRGHTAIAVDAGHRWVLHAGDAFYHRSVLEGQPRVPRIIAFQEALVATDRDQLREGQQRLAELHQRQDPSLLVVCSHDPDLFEQARRSA